jgi:hypothetical protein
MATANCEQGLNVWAIFEEPFFDGVLIAKTHHQFFQKRAVIEKPI